MIVGLFFKNSRKQDAVEVRGFTIDPGVLVKEVAAGVFKFCYGNIMQIDDYEDVIIGDLVSINARLEEVKKSFLQSIDSEPKFQEKSALSYKMFVMYKLALIYMKNILEDNWFLYFQVLCRLL